MATMLPKVSIGLPVFNGENYISECIESILDQTYNNFELIISDNASDDKTELICKKYANLDKRVRYLRNKKNIGAGPNFNKTFYKSNGEYFRWMAHDDLCHSEYLEECLKVLEEDRSIVLCHSKTQFIDENSEAIEHGDVLLSQCNLEKVADRFREVIAYDHWCIEVFGLIRKEALRRTKLIANYVGSDRNLLADLCLMGKFHQIPKILFYHREHSKRSVSNNTIHERAEWWNPGLANKITMPFFRALFEYFCSVNRSSIDLKEKGECYLSLLSWLSQNWKNLYWDTKVVAKKYTIKKWSEN